MTNASPYLLLSVCNGHPVEQALIRRWWRESFEARGVLVWEYCLAPNFADAVILLDLVPGGSEHRGKRSNQLFPIAGARIVLCEAKFRFTPELLGQALVHRERARAAGAQVMDTFVFAELADELTIRLAVEHGLKPVIEPVE